MSTVLDNVAQRAVTWSVTADRVKSRFEKVRWLVFGLSIAGALAAALASQIPGDASGSSKGHLYMAILGATLLAVATFFSKRLLGDSEPRAWVRARAASEALKREAFKFSVNAEPYNDSATAENLLNTERAKIENDVDDLVGHLVEPDRQGSAPRQFLSPKDYRKKRVLSQINEYYRPKAQEYRKIASRLRTTEFVLALAATLITAFAGVTGKTLVVGGAPFDFAALTAVLTTVAGAILAHIEASRFDHLIDKW